MAITCPWCGTNYQTFQSNCSNCGGPLPAPISAADQGELPLEPPPPAPRPISDSYVRKLMATDGLSITGFVFALIGAIFTVLGGGLTLGVITAFVGVPFLLLGVIFLFGGGLALYGRYREKLKEVNVLRYGEAALGMVTNLHENLHVSVNNRHPWVIEYEFLLNGQTYSGQVATLNPPASRLQTGHPAYVLYHPESPALNTLYPHP